METETILLIIALTFGAYMAWNIGANDVSNAIGTSVGSGAISLRQAIFIAATLEFCGAFFFGSHVSATVQRGIVNPDFFMNRPMELAYGMISTLVAAGVWLQLATYFGWPVSTTHSIVGALTGFGWAIGGWRAVYWAKVGFIGMSWLLSPLMGGLIAYCIFSVLRRHIFYSHQPVVAAKRIIPWLAFSVITILVEVLLLKGFKNLHLNLTLPDSLAISCGAGAVFGLGSKFLVSRIDVDSHKEDQPHPPLDPKARIALNKAKKHLLRAQEAVGDDAMRSRIDRSIRRVDAISAMTGPAYDESHTHRDYRIVEQMFGYLQIVTACFMAFSHGANDVANAIGPLSAAIAVLTEGTVALKATIPAWILALGGVGILIGLATWGWRVIETIGRKITELTPSRGFSAEFGAATTIVIATALGLPVSTTHTLVGAVLGVGLARGIGAINLNTIRDIFNSWLMTIPAGAIIAIVCFHIMRSLFGT